MAEIKPFSELLITSITPDINGFYNTNQNSIKIRITGVGLVETTFNLYKILLSENFDLVLNVGIAGTYTDRIANGDVVEIIMDRFGDIGAKDKDRNFLDVFELKLVDKNQTPYIDGWLENKCDIFKTDFPKVIGNSVNCCNGVQSEIDELLLKYPFLDIETMENAAVFFVANQLNINVQSFRAISNKVEARDKSKWQIPLAIKALNDFLINHFLKN